ncbi:MAG: tripartite tricarboxylate transporter substrate binding protein, partial [Betaproteobacteria bacterium]|nr:tripartite tricarboxylate transporter substrate binding protein [Betaproteobacteria bacterium]
MDFPTDTGQNGTFNLKIFIMLKTLQHQSFPIFKFARDALATALLMSLACSLSHAQSPDYPVKPVKIIAPSAPGGGFDLVGRVLAAKLSEQLGQQFVVENRSGGGTLVGTQTAAKSVPDGYTLLVGGLSNMALNMGLYKQPGYDPLQDFVPLRLVVSHSYTLIGRKDLPFNNLKELISYSQAHPNKLNIGSSGPGTGQFILASLLQTVGKADLQIIPYKGAQPVYLDLLADRVDLFFDNSTTTRPHITNNR